MKLTYINKYLLLATLCVFGMSSCKKFLDEKPLATSSEDVVFLNPNSAKMAVLGVYNQLAGDFAYGWRLSMQYPYDTDEAIGYSLTNDVQRELNSYGVTSGNLLLIETFNQLYSGVERANICIYNIPKMPAYTNGSEADIAELKRLHGEALTLRAQFYFDLVKLWGDVPAQWLPSSLLSKDQYIIPKTDRDVIYEKLLEDLKVASELVPWRGESAVAPDERITKGAVKALRARIALFRGGYSLRKNRVMERGSDYLTYYAIARDECNDIILSGKHDLNASFENVWRDGLLSNHVEPNGEVLFEVAHGGENPDSDSRLGVSNSIQIIDPNSGSSRNDITPTTFYAFHPLDKRRDVSCAPIEIRSLNYNGLSLIRIDEGKWRRDWVTPTIAITDPQGYYGMNFPLIRFSDVLLMYAEAVNEISGPNGEGGAAITAVNRVRRRSWTTGGVQRITVTNPGINYTSAPTVAITGGGGTGATAVAIVAAGSVTEIRITSAGANYTSNPTVTFTGGGGTTAAATAAISTATSGDLTVAETAPGAFLTAIQNERLLEFTSEAIRKYDLIRWNLLGTKIAETKANLAKIIAGTFPYNAHTPAIPNVMYFRKNSKTGIVWGNSFYAPTALAASFPTATWTGVNWRTSLTTTSSLMTQFADGFTPGKSELLPIPIHAIEDSNYIITQDYGYF
ncbi:RagB/SusD family nutrient uptake outer membrane protein [Pedobacter heparinus]|uniref:RagB/SusD family nutrient uptake outer membrane protein n=1 Tax=Pedobacter heparinus TaxID=984 RepID=UPI00292E98E1|nr:RagB/SusD family nutrient uptake outer membrane protein [Pedobacter heparinus]